MGNSPRNGPVLQDSQTSQKVEPKAPIDFKPEDFSTLDKKLISACTEVIESCKLDKNALNTEVLKGIFNDLKNEAISNPELISKLNKYFGLNSEGFDATLFTKIMLDPKIRRVIGISPNGKKLENVLTSLNPNQSEKNEKSTIKKQPGTEAKESEYNKNLKGIGESLENALGISLGLVTRIIEQESLFGAATINAGKSTGLMQLNSAPFDNMKQQPEKYKEYFSKIPLDIVDQVKPDGAKNTIISIINEYSKDNLDKNKISSLIESLHTFARKMPNSKDLHILNMICGSITLAFGENEKIYNHNGKGEKTSLKTINLKQVNNFSTDGAVKELTSHKGYILNDGDKKLVSSILSEIKAEINKPGDSQTKNDYLTAREYNGSSTKNEYALNVLISRRFNELKQSK